MFTSSNSFPSSTHGFLPTNSGIIFGQEKDGVYFSHYPFVTGACSFDPPPPIKENSDNNMNLSDSVISPSRKRVAASKKDRHSKIFTAQGPRDRRVRLSIDISRKFFGLQDLLGFDKASKTLDWLFTKSTIAIKDLVEEMKHTSSSTLSDQCEQVFMEKGDHLEKKGKVPKCVNGGKKKKKTTQKQKSVSHVNLGARKQLRAEARARARVRTIEKLRIKKLNIDVKNVLGDTNYCSLQSTGGNQVQSQSNNEVKFGESYVEQKLPKPYSLIYNSQFKNSTH